MADWNYVAECTKVCHPEITLFGSGDVLSFEDYENFRKTSDVDGILLAR